MKTFLIAVLAVFSCLLVVFAPEARAASETRALAGFDAIALSGSIDIVLRQGPRQSVVVEGSADQIARVETRVEGGTLVVRPRAGETLRGPVRVAIDVVGLKAIAQHGSGDIRIEGLQTPALEISLSGSGDASIHGLQAGSLRASLSGSGDITADGRADTVEISGAGSGDADLGGLAAQEVRVHLAGSGDANVNADRRLDVSIAGSGDLRYGGAVQQVNASVAGSGSVRRR